MNFFITSNPKTKFLFDQAVYDIYFVVATAYDYSAVDAGERKLLWRTTMTVNTQGVSMVESLPVLIASGASFLGQDMAAAATLNAPVHRGTKVEIGPLKVVDL